MARLRRSPDIYRKGQTGHSTGYLYYDIMCGASKTGEAGVTRVGNFDRSAGFVGDWKAWYIGPGGGYASEDGFRTRNAAMKWLRARARKIPCRR